MGVPSPGSKWDQLPRRPGPDNWETASTPGRASPPCGVGPLEWGWGVNIRWREINRPVGPTINWEGSGRRWGTGDPWAEPVVVPTPGTSLLGCQVRRPGRGGDPLEVKGDRSPTSGQDPFRGDLWFTWYYLTVDPGTVRPSR